MFAIQTKPRFMHPVIFIPAFTSLGVLFAFQQWMSLRLWGYHIRALIVFESWATEFLTWGMICWLVWRSLRTFIRTANFRQIVTWLLPLSIFASAVQEMVTVAFFPNLPLDLPRMPYWHRVAFHFRAEMLDNLVIFWCAFFLFRGLAYYQQFREKEQAEAQLEAQLANARLSALRMQLNPHFLFNAMNSVSSLMHCDVQAADAMLEQLSGILRMTLERGDVQLITVQEEMAFIESYLAIQGHRYAGRVDQRVNVDPDLLDALIPSMILQPIVENAFVHGLSCLSSGGELSISIRKDDNQIAIRVKNNGSRSESGQTRPQGRPGVGLENVKCRLRLHYGDDATFRAFRVGPNIFQVSITAPIQFATTSPESILRYDLQ
jgi:two-component system, LytTR family, sensor kinase